MLLLGSIAVFAQTAQSKSKMALVSGVIDLDSSSTVKNIYLFSVLEGSRVLFASTKIADDGSYAFALSNPKEGLYYISFADDPNRGKNYIRLYVKRGDNLVMNFLNNGSQDTLISGSAEQKKLTAWQKLSADVYDMGMGSGDTATYVSFFPALDKLLPKAEKMKTTIATPNKKFNRFLVKLIDVDIQCSALSMLLTPRTKHPNKSEWSKYYAKTFHSNMFCDAFLAENGDGLKLIRFYTSYMYMTGDSIAKMEFREKPYADICNDTLKGIYIASTLKGYKTYEALEKNMTLLRKYLVSDHMQQQYFDALKSVSTFKPNTPAYNFNYPDSTGTKYYSLRNELAGKVVYVDMWATWCMPCRAEIPYLQKIEEELKDENIAFVSISVDASKEKWLDFLQKNKLGGLQLYGGGNNDMIKFYSINGIPRFMLFDTKGNIVSIDAPRPSSIELKDLLIKTLKAE
jgi:thiol-disulfide isomerase/thioredoxin